MRSGGCLRVCVLSPAGGLSKCRNPYRRPASGKHAGCPAAASARRRCSFDAGGDSVCENGALMPCRCRNRAECDDMRAFGLCGIPVPSAGEPDADISRNASHICAAPGDGLRNIGIGAPARGGAAEPVLLRGFPGLDAFAAPVPVRASGCGGPADGRRGAASMPVREKCRGHSREPPGRACGI